MSLFLIGFVFAESDNQREGNLEGRPNDTEKICCKSVHFENEKTTYRYSTEVGCETSDSYEVEIVNDEFCEQNQEQNRERVEEKNRLRFGERTGQECPEECECSGSTIKCILENGNREMRVYAGNSGNIIVQVKGKNMSTNVSLYKQNGTLWGQFRNNETKEIKLFPDQIQERLRTKLKAKFSEEETEIELEEDGSYRIQTKKQSRFLGMFKVRERVRAQIDVTTGEIGKINSPWWGFLANDIEEEPILGSSCGTVSPDSRDECCQNKGYDLYDLNSAECVFSQ